MLHVEVWLQNDKGEDFGYVETGSSGSANVFLPIQMTTAFLYVYCWAHRMSVIGSDFHFKITVYM